MKAIDKDTNTLKIEIAESVAEAPTYTLPEYNYASIDKMLIVKGGYG